MNMPLSLSPLVPALISAGAYTQEPHEESVHTPLPLLAGSHIRRARVELYCDHNTQAVLYIRAALTLLSASPAPVSPDVMAALAQAAWLARHDQYAEAEAALNAALAAMEAPGLETH